jgi:hypothetical protein
LEKKVTVNKVKLANSYNSISLLDFNVLPSAHPRKFKKEVARQAVERGDEPADEVAATPAPPVKFSGSSPIPTASSRKTQSSAMFR